MATEVTITVAPRAGSRIDPATDRVLQAALAVFHEVEANCTRFNSSSPLMRANASPRRWHQVPDVLYRALLEARSAHQRTSGLFDPRVLTDLVALGYDRTLAFTAGDVVTPRTPPLEGRPRGTWRPRFRHDTREVLLEEGVDLGGIGKGLAVRWSSQRLAVVTSNFLVEAGGDCYCAGSAPDGEGWRVGVEDPFGGDEPLAVLALVNRAVTTSSVRLRQWRCGDEKVHHLIDPSTGRPGGQGLVSVTVVGKDPAAAEVNSKVLFLAGRSRIAASARQRGVAALWVDEQGGVGASDNVQHYLLWRRP